MASINWNYKVLAAVDATLATGKIAGVVPIQLNRVNAPGFFTNSNAGATDLRVTAADGITFEPFSVQSFDQTNKLAEVWVNVSAVQVSNGSIGVQDLYYNNPTQTTTASFANTFTLPTKLATTQNLWLFNEGTGTTVHDTAGSNNLTLSGNKTPTVPPTSSTARSAALLKLEATTRNSTRL